VSTYWTFPNLWTCFRTFFKFYNNCLNFQKLFKLMYNAPKLRESKYRNKISHKWGKKSTSISSLTKHSLLETSKNYCNDHKQYIFYYGHPIQWTILGPTGSFISSRAILAPLLGIFLNPRGLGYSQAQALLLCFSAFRTQAFWDLLIDSYIKLLNHLIFFFEKQTHTQGRGKGVLT